MSVLSEFRWLVASESDVENNEPVADNQEPGLANQESVSDNPSSIDLNLGNDSGPANSSGKELVPFGGVRQSNELQTESFVGNGDEPYVGQEFETEEAAHAYYAAYGTRMGFMTRMSSITRRDGIIVRRTLVCNKEGYYTNRCGKEKKRPRTLTRVGCKANIVIRKLSTGIWVVKKIIKEHNHPLAERQIPNVGYVDHDMTENKRIQELTTQLLREKKRSASFRKIIDVLVNHIKEHTEDLAKTAQSIGDKINEIESTGKRHKKNPR